MLECDTGGNIRGITITFTAEFCTIWFSQRSVMVEDDSLKGGVVLQKVIHDLSLVMTLESDRESVSGEVNSYSFEINMGLDLALAQFSMCEHTNLRAAREGPTLPPIVGRGSALTQCSS